MDDTDLEQADVQLYETLSFVDALITDYSSVAIDYLLMDRPIAFTLDDYEKYRAYTLADGAIVAFDPAAQGCELPIGTQMTKAVLDGSSTDADLSSCLGFIDVNGVTLPNKEVTCTTAASDDGTGGTSLEVEKPCAVKNDANHMTDVFPIVFHDATVEPASNAAKYVLTSAK